MDNESMTSKQVDLIELYYLRGLTLRQLGEVVGVSRTTISNLLNERGTTKRPPGAIRKTAQPNTSRLLEEFSQAWADTRTDAHVQL